MCVTCGVSLSGGARLPNISVPNVNIPKVDISKVDFDGLVKDKSLIFGGLALLGCFFPWIKVKAFYSSNGFNLFKLSELVEIAPDTILISPLLYLFPLSLLAFILSGFVAPLARYKDITLLASLILVVYIGLGLFLLKNSSAPDMSSAGNDLGEVFGGIMKSAQAAAADMMSVSYGFYFSLLATIAGFFAKRRRKAEVED